MGLAMKSVLCVEKARMLYERWREVVRDRTHEVALREPASERCWTFGQLDRQVENLVTGASELVCPQGNSADFVFAVLCGWRQGSVVCPLEPYDRPPSIPLPPSRCRHLKTIAATNGALQAVAFTEEQLADDVENIVATMGLRPDWPNLGVISLAHSYGFSGLVLPLLLHGIPLTLVPSALPEVVRRAAQSHPKLTLPAVPALWRIWHAAGAIPPNVVLGISAGAPLPLALERAVFAAQGLKIHNFLGASECGGISYDPTLVPREDEASVGHLLKNVEAGVNGDGVLVVRSRAVGETYWPNPSEKLGGGCFQTNDLADLKDGLVCLRGRVGDQINVAGRKIFPAVIEQALRQHASVMECLVFGVPDETAGRTDVIVACVAPREKGDAAQLRQFLLGKLPGWQVPREWWFVKSLDANTCGKVSRAEWRGKFLEWRALGSAEGRYRPKTGGFPEEVVFRQRAGKNA